MLVTFEADLSSDGFSPSAAPAESFEVLFYGLSVKASLVNPGVLRF